MLLKDFIRKNPNDSFDMMTPGGFVFLTPEQAKDLLAGKSVMGHPGDPAYAMRIDAEELLCQPVESAHWENHVCHMMTGMPSEVISSKTAEKAEKKLSEHEKEQHLKERLKANYEAYIQQLRTKSVPDLIEMATEISATKFVYTQLSVGSEYSEYTDYLLQFENPLQVVCNGWLDYEGYDYDEELEFMLQNMADQGIDEREAAAGPTLEQGVTMC